MNWADERYIRVYTRDTGDLLVIGWEGRAVLWELMRKLDRAGVLDLGSDLEVLPELLRLPHDMCMAGFDRLRSRGVVQVNGKYIVMPNFLEAQEAAQSDKQRQEDSRARRRDLAHAKDLGVTIRDQQSRNVTDCHETQQNVTIGHTESQSVTVGHSVPSRAVPSRAVPNHATAVACVGTGAEPRVMALALVEPASGDWRDEAIDAAYERYPRKRERGAGAKRFRSQLKTRVDGQALLQAVQNYATTVVGREPDKIKLWPTFASCWRDYVDMPIEPMAAERRLSGDDLREMAKRMAEGGEE